jgi:RimJ/RimL family protein N-acetyltransferase
MTFGPQFRLTKPGFSIASSIVPWDSQAFGFPVAQIDRIDVADVIDASAAYHLFEQWRDRLVVRMVTCRLDHFALRESMFLEARGFRFVELVYRPSLSLEHTDFPESELVIEPALPADLPEIEAIAGYAFSTGRYLLDWRLNPAHSHLRYRNWVRTSASSADHEVLKGSLNGEIVGFFVIEKRPDKSVYWHLTAMAKQWQGQGLGKRLWQAFAMRARRDGASRIETTISGHNLPVVNLYARLGFCFDGAQLTLHWLDETLHPLGPELPQFGENNE